MRAKTPAFARRQRPDGDKPGDDSAEPAPAATPKGPTAGTTEPTITEGRPLEEVADVETAPIAAARPDPKDLPDIVPPDPRDEPWPDATPPPMRPVSVTGEQKRPHNATVGMPVVVSDYGRPPDMPTTVAPPPLVLGDVENPAHMPMPREIPGGNPDDAAPAPGHVPPGDSRSLRRANEFALVYRIGTSVISRFGRVGTRGQWRVVEYPTSASASNAYAKECSRFVSEGFSDYRD